MEPLTIMIIDDEEAHFTLMNHAIVKKFPHASVYHFKEANDCLKRLDEIEPTVIITDYLLPGMNGIEFLEALNQQDIDIPVIMITGQGDENIAVRTMKLGAKEYLVKSGDVFNLLPGVIEQVVRERKLEQSLRESEEKYRLLVDNAPVVIVVTRDGFLQFVNHQAKQITGYSKEELISRPFVDFIHPDDQAMVMEHHIKRLSGEEIPELYLLRIIRKDGKTIWLENSGVLLTWEEKPATLNFLNDITERKRVEDALHKSEKQKKTILDTSLDQIRYVDADLKIIWANKTVSFELGVPPGDVVGQFCYKLLRDRDAPCEGCPTVRARETRQVERSDMVYYGRKVKKREKHWDLYSAPLIDEANDISGFIQIARDITERKQAENRVRNLTQMLMKSQERERQMISYELHDRIAQNLSTLKIGCDTLLKYQQGISHELEKKIAEFSKIAEQTIINVRELAYELRPPGIDEMGLIRAIGIYCEEFAEKSGLEVDFQSFGMQASTLDDDTKIHLYRFIQEGLNNIRKHADASRATIRLVGASPDIILRIEDNGKGFDVKERELALSNEKRMGLRSMSERANLLQGQMTIQSHLMKGTKIFIKFPSKEQNSESEETHINH